MTVSLYESQVKQAERDVARLRVKKAGLENRKLDLERSISQLETKSAKASSNSMARSYRSQAETKRRKLESMNRDLVRANDELGRAHSRLTDRENKLARARTEAERRERDKQERERKQAERRQKLDDQRQQRERQRIERAEEQRNRQRDNQLSQLSEQTSELTRRLAEAQRRAAPPEITVLFLAASPVDQTRLRLGPETREIQKRVRASEHRDAVNLEWRLGRQLADLIEELSEVEPDVLHFSGHSDTAVLALETPDGKTAPLAKDQLERLIAVSGKSIRLVIFNSCHSAALASSICQAGTVDVAIGMNAAITNEAAKIFAGQFYASIGNGHSVLQAFEEARLQLDLVDTASEDLPQLFSAEGVEPNAVVLVNPDAADDVAAADL
jgi:hypothetical protein